MARKIMMVLALLLIMGCVRTMNKKVGEVNFTPDRSWGVETMGLLRTFEVGEGDKKKKEVERLSIYGNESIPDDTTGLFFLIKLVSRDGGRHRLECEFIVEYGDGVSVETQCVQYQGSGKSFKHRVDCLQDIDPRRAAEVTLVVHVCNGNGDRIFSLQPVRFRTPAFIEPPPRDVPERYMKGRAALVRTFRVGSGTSSRIEHRELPLDDLNPLPRDTLGFFLLCSSLGLGEHRVVSELTIDYQDGLPPTRTRANVYEGSEDVRHQIDLLRHVDPRREARVTVVVKALDMEGGEITSIPPVEYLAPVFIKTVVRD